MSEAILYRTRSSHHTPDYKDISIPRKWTLHTPYGMQYPRDIGGFSLDIGMKNNGSQVRLEEDGASRLRSAP